MIIQVNGKDVEAIKVNGRSYPLWSKFCLDPSWVGGTLQDLDPDSGGAAATITKITLTPNGTDSAMFEIHTAAGWGCGCDTRYLGIEGRSQTPGWLTFHGWGGHQFRICKPGEGAQSLCA